MKTDTYILRRKNCLCLQRQAYYIGQWMIHSKLFIKGIQYLMVSYLRANYLFHFEYIYEKLYKYSCSLDCLYLWHLFLYDRVCWGRDSNSFKIQQGCQLFKQWRSRDNVWESDCLDTTVFLDQIMYTIHIMQVICVKAKTWCI